MLATDPVPPADVAVGPTVPELLRAYAGSAARCAALLVRHRLRLSHHMVGRRMMFADGSSASRVYRDTVRVGAPTQDPVLLVVGFRLRLIGRSRPMHALFRLESILNTPLFAGFPGFRSKLWITDESSGSYRGVYQWNGQAAANAYAAAIVALLRPLSEPGTVRAHIEPGIRRDDFVLAPASVGCARPGAWWSLRA